MTLLSKINGKKVGKPEWIALWILLALPFFTECFYDLLATYAHGYAFLKAICHLDFFKSYDYAWKFIREYGVDETLKLMGPAYAPSIYLIFAVWSIPVALIRKIWEISIFEPGIILWYKSLLVISSILCYKKLDGILEFVELSKGKRTFAGFIFFSSLFFVMPTMAMSQYDIFTVFFILWGIELYIKEYKSIKWIALFGLAATFKSFALLIFFPMLLLKEKGVLKVIGKLMLSVIPTLVCSLLFCGNELYRETTKSFYGGFIKRLFASTVAGGNSPIVLFVGGMIALCIWAYVRQNRTSAKDSLTDVAWVGTTAFSLMLLFVYCHPQWCLLILPFAVLLIILNDRKTKINSILMYFAETALTFYYILHFGWVYCTNVSMSFTLIKELGVHSYESNSLSEAFHQLFDYMFDSSIFTIFVVAIIGIIVMNYPRVCAGDKNDEWFMKEQDYGMVVVRLVTVFVLWMIDLLINLGIIL